MRAVLSKEGHLFNQDERLILSRYRKLSRKECLWLPVARNSSELITADARHLLILLCTRKPEKWFRLKNLDGYRKRFGDRIPDIMDELCRDLVKPIVEGPEPEPGVEVVDLAVDDDQGNAGNSDTFVNQTMPAPAQPPTLQVHPMVRDQTIGNAETSAAPTIPVKVEAVEVQVKIEDVPLAPRTVSVKLEATDQETINPPIPSMPNSFCSDTAPKVEENSQPGPSCLPPQPWEYVVVARDEEHAPTEELLNCLAIEELQSFVRSLKVKCASKKVSFLQ